MVDSHHQKRVACVAIPLHKSELTHFELIALQQCAKILGSHPIVLFTPLGLNIDVALEVVPNARVIRLEPRWLASIDAYNRLMLSAGFYEAFAEFENILIHQLDAFVFKDQLHEWATMGFDYIGAPWPDGDRVYPHNFRGAHRLNQLFPFWNKPSTYYVGNGGLSLRNVASCLRMIREHPALAAHWPCNEDIFWPHIASLDKDRYSIPNPQIAARFAQEQQARSQIETAQGQLPFGCHAWYKIDTDHWFPLIRSFGYAL